VPPNLSPEASLLTEILAGNELVVVDVGAANGVLPWFRSSQEVATFYLFEPEKKAYDKLVAELVEAGRSNVKVINTALASTRGTRKLHVTNKPTGSSILPIRADATEYTPSSYFYPIREVEIETEPLGAVLDTVKQPLLHLMKIDVQGGELEVLRGLDDARAKAMLSVEVEVGMPGAYEGQPSFATVNAWMEERGLVLFDLQPAHARLTLDDERFGYHTKVFNTFRSDTSVRPRIFETELVYFRREDEVLAKRDGGEVRRLCAAYAIHDFVAHAHRLAGRAAELGLLDAKPLQDSIVRWHRGRLDRSLPGRMRRAVKRVANRTFDPAQMTKVASRLAKLGLLSR